MPAVCTTLSTLLACGKRSDCRWSGSACLVGAAVATCGSYTTGSTCQAASCYWDTFVPGGARCLYNLQELNQNFPCSTWSYYPSIAYACGVHGCGYSGNLCFTVDSGISEVSSGYSASASVRYSTLNTGIAPHTTTFSTQVVVPFSSFFQPMQPVFHSILLGYPTLPGAIQNGACTDWLDASVLAESGTSSARAFLSIRSHGTASS